MAELQRVRDPISGHEYTPTPGQMRVSGLGDGDVIDKPALAPSGSPAPVLYRTPLGKPRTGSKAHRRRTQNSPAAVAEEPSGPAEAEPHEEEN